MSKQSYLLLLSIYVASHIENAHGFSSVRVVARTPSHLYVESSDSSRRNFFEQSASSVSAAVLANIIGLPIEPASAAVSGSNKVNARLKGFGLPVMSNIPDGFSPLLEIYGKGKNRFPLLVTFAHPLSWVVTTPSNNVNGEDGTVQAGDYAKGDTATFFVYEAPGHVDDITKQPKSLYEDTLQKAIGQRGANMFQNFKITKAEPYTYSDGQKYVIVDFKYQLLTGAGFEVDRKGVASITSEGAAVEALWAASTAPRFKKTEESLRNIVSTFRCYAEGINFSNDLIVYDT
jgi:hypothetical protein